MGSSFEPLCHTKRHDKYILPASLPKTKRVWTSPLSVISETVQYSIFLIICVWETVQKSWIRGIYFRHCWLLFQKLSTIYHMTCVQQNVFHTALKIFQEGFFLTTKQTASKEQSSSWLCPWKNAILRVSQGFIQGSQGSIWTFIVTYEIWFSN